MSAKILEYDAMVQASGCASIAILATNIYKAP
jgi:hypothetical protein